MKRLCNDLEFELSGLGAKIPYQCEFCEKIFYQTKRYVLAQLAENKPVNFCSKKCMGKYRKEEASTSTLCDDCGEATIIVPRCRVGHDHINNYCEKCIEKHRRTSRVNEVKKVVKPGNVRKSKLNPEEAIAIETAKALAFEQREAERKKKEEEKRKAIEKLRTWKAAKERQEEA